MRYAHFEAEESQTVFIAWRFYFLIILILLVVAGLIARLIDLTIIKQDFLLHQGNERAMRTLTIPAFRGMITDRDGHPLAISAIVYSIWMNPKEFLVTKENLAMLSSSLGMKEPVIQSIVKRNQHREFAYLVRGVSPEVANKVNKLAIKGIYLRQDYKRYYPEGEVTSQVIGLTNIDDQGQEGLELLYHSWLSGMPGKQVVVLDRLGHVVSFNQTIIPQKPGNNLVLSLNRHLQYIAYRELLAGVKKYLVSSASVVILDIKTGEVLAMVNLPSFNPNNTSRQKETLRNRAVTDTFEPGSTIKAFSVLAALSSGLYQPNSIIDTYPGWLRVGHRLVRDEHTKGPMSVTKILQISSNVGVTKMILSLPPNQLWEWLHRVGFGEETGIGFPGERSGALIKRDKWDPFALATLAFGYGLSVTTLQLAEAYAILANDGIKIPPSLLKVDHPPEGKRVLDSAMSKTMLALLESVVARGGTATAAHIPGYHVAGKTGTARMVGEHGYEKHHYTSSFVGISPVTNPRLIVAVVMHDPQGKLYLGGDVSAPVFKNIMEEALRALNIPPDDPETLYNHG